MIPVSSPSRNASIACTPRRICSSSAKLIVVQLCKAKNSENSFPSRIRLSPLLIITTFDLSWWRSFLRSPCVFVLRKACVIIGRVRFARPMLSLCFSRLVVEAISAPSKFTFTVEREMSLHIRSAIRRSAGVYNTIALCKT